MTKDRQFSTLDAASDEADYICTIQPSAPGTDYRGDPECFKRYCRMQARRILACGWRRTAREIFQHIGEDLPS